MKNHHAAAPAIAAWKEGESDVLVVKSFFFFIKKRTSSKKLRGTNISKLLLNPDHDSAPRTKPRPAAKWPYQLLVFPSTKCRHTTPQSKTFLTKLIDKINNFKSRLICIPFNWKVFLETTTTFSKKLPPLNSISIGDAQLKRLHSKVFVYSL